MLPLPPPAWWFLQWFSTHRRNVSYESLAPITALKHSSQEVQTGTLNGARWAGDCRACAPGTYSTAVGAVMPSTCSPCEAGTHGDRHGSISCEPCPAGTYSAAGAVECSSCPSNTSSPSGSTRIADCTCSVGYTGSGTACAACDAGTYKDWSGPGGCISQNFTNVSFDLKLVLSW